VPLEGADGACLGRGLQSRLGVFQVSLAFFAVGDILRHRRDGEDVAVVVANRDEGELVRPPVDTVLERGGFPVEGGLVTRNDDLGDLGREYIPYRSSLGSSLDTSASPSGVPRT